MKLAQYIKANSLTVEAFAKKIGRHRQSVHRYINGTRVPDVKTLVAIQKVTEGAVAFNDFVSPTDHTHTEERG